MKKIIIAIVLLLGTSAHANPFHEVNRNDAKADCLKALRDRYPESHGAVLRLIKRDMKAFDELVLIEKDPDSDLVLDRLYINYYPSYSAILRLYKKEMDALEELRGV